VGRKPVEPKAAKPKATEPKAAKMTYMQLRRACIAAAEREAADECLSQYELEQLLSEFS